MMTVADVIRLMFKVPIEHHEDWTARIIFTHGEDGPGYTSEELDELLPKDMGLELWVYDADGNQQHLPED